MARRAKQMLADSCACAAARTAWAPCPAELTQDRTQDCSGPQQAASFCAQQHAFQRSAEGWSCKRKLGTLWHLISALGFCVCSQVLPAVKGLPLRWLGRNCEHVDQLAARRFAVFDGHQARSIGLRCGAAARINSQQAVCALNLRWHLQKVVTA